MSSLLRLVVLAVIATASSVAIAKRLETQAAPRIASDELMEVVRTLASPAYQGRRTGTEGNKRARAYLLDQFAKTKLRPIGAGYAFPFRVTRSSKSGADGERAELDGVNLVGVCHGTGAADNGAMVISAHYDHVGVRAGAVYPGADDNASGVATLLALARYCTTAPWTHDAVFAAFDAEESGLQGARAFVSEPPISRGQKSNGMFIAGSITVFEPSL